MARTAVIGAASAEQRRMFAAVRKALEEAESMMRAGTHTSAITQHAAQVMSACGFRPELTTLTMHPIGLQVFDYTESRHESEGWTLESDSVVNFEVFYRDSEYGGVHLEDSVLISAAGARPLAPEPRDLLELH
jgi:Xaa-Pro aminopeptidase